MIVVCFLNSDSLVFESNCFLLVDGGRGILIDAGVYPESRLRRIEELNMTLDLLINTHCHFDHAGGDSFLVEKTGVKVAVHESDALSIESGGRETMSGLFNNAGSKVKVDLKLKDNQVIKYGGIKLQVIHTPGHTPGSICLYECKSKLLFTGDTVFKDGVGRTDFPGGSQSDLKTSVRKLVEFAKENDVCRVYPGHGPVAEKEDLKKAYSTYF